MYHSSDAWYRKARRLPAISSTFLMDLQHWHGGSGVCEGNIAGDDLLRHVSQDHLYPAYTCKQITAMATHHLSGM
jgi:hypothetical protein